MRYLVSIMDGADAPYAEGDESYGGLVGSAWYDTKAEAVRAARKVASVIVSPVIIEDENQIIVKVVQS